MVQENKDTREQQAGELSQLPAMTEKELLDHLLKKTQSGEFVWKFTKKTGIDYSPIFEISAFNVSLRIWQTTRLAALDIFYSWTLEITTDGNDSMTIEQGEGFLFWRNKLKKIHAIAQKPYQDQLNKTSKAERTRILRKLGSDTAQAEEEEAGKILPFHKAGKDTTQE